MSVVCERNSFLEFSLLSWSGVTNHSANYTLSITWIFRVQEWIHCNQVCQSLKTINIPGYYTIRDSNYSVGTICLPSLDNAYYDQATKSSRDYLISNTPDPFDSVYDTSGFIYEHQGEQDLLIQDFHSYLYQHPENDSQPSVLTCLRSDPYTPVYVIFV